MSLLSKTSRLLPRNGAFFHTSCISRQEWTKASLRRMKKPELIRLAKENNLDNISGTKNDIIIQLLSHQTAKIVGSPSFIRQIVDKTDESPIDAVLATEPTQRAAIETAVEDVDVDWVNAFDIKVAQRGSRKPLSKPASASLASKPHRFNDMIKKTTVVKPVVEEDATPAVQDQKATQAVNTTVEEVDGMDPQWVEAFNLKVGSRGARSHSKFSDTLTPSPKPTITSQIEFIANRDHHKEPAVATPVAEEATKEGSNLAKQPSAVESAKQSTTEQSSQPSAESIKQSTTEQSSAESTNQSTIDTATNGDHTSSSRDTWINTAVGSSMFFWYFGGEDGSLSKIWHFLSSSS
jgi:hypothetical protein